MKPPYEKLESDTPRTDEEVEIAKRFPATSHGLWVSAEFTRQLERELAEKSAALVLAVAHAEDSAALVSATAKQKQMEELWAHASTCAVGSDWNRETETLPQWAWRKLSAPDNRRKE